MEADPCIIPSPAPESAGQSFQTPKHHLLQPRDANKANDWGTTKGGQVRAAPTPATPGHLAMVSETPALAQSWLWHSV